MRLNARGVIASMEREWIEQRDFSSPGVCRKQYAVHPHTVVNQFPINPMNVVNRMQFTRSLSFTRILLSLTVCSQPSVSAAKFSANTVY